jgi:hypothetical protein
MGAINYEKKNTFPASKTNPQIKRLYELIRAMRLEVMSENRPERLDELVRQLIHTYDKIHHIHLQSASRDTLLRLLYAIRCLRRDYKSGGLTNVENRIPVLLASFGHPRSPIGGANGSSSVPVCCL